MLHYRHKFNCIKAMILDIFNYVSCNLIHGALFPMSSCKGFQRNLADRKCIFIKVKPSSVCQPLFIIPGNLLEVSDYRNNSIFALWLKGIWVRSLIYQTTSCLDFKLVAIELFGSWNKYLKNADRIKPMHLTNSSIPVVEIANNTNSCSWWCPNCELSAIYAPSGHRMCSKLFIYMIVNAAGKLDKIFSIHKWSKGIRINFFSLYAFRILYDKAILYFFYVRNDHCKEACFISKFHLIFLFCIFYPDLYRISIRIKSLNQVAVPHLMSP